MKGDLVLSVGDVWICDAAIRNSFYDVGLNLNRRLLWTMEGLLIVPKLIKNKLTELKNV